MILQKFKPVENESYDIKILYNSMEHEQFIKVDVVNLNGKIFWLGNNNFADRLVLLNKNINCITKTYSLICIKDDPTIYLANFNRNIINDKNFQYYITDDYLDIDNPACLNIEYKRFDVFLTGKVTLANENNKYPFFKDEFIKNKILSTVEQIDLPKYLEEHIYSNKEEFEKELKIHLTIEALKK